MPEALQIGALTGLQRSDAYENPSVQFNKHCEAPSLPPELLQAVRSAPPQESTEDYHTVHKWWWIVYIKLLREMLPSGNESGCQKLTDLLSEAQTSPDERSVRFVIYSLLQHPKRGQADWLEQLTFGMFYCQ